jgi:tripartite-type tricarboxylate transporter receptor subunit TctC
MKRHFIIFVLAFGVFLVFVTNSPAASEFPKKPITIIYPWNPGGAAEIDARALASVLESKFKKRVLVTNKVGGAGAAATIFVKNAKPDGHTILQGWIIHMVLHIMRNPAIGYSSEDFFPIARSQVSEIILIVKKDAPWKTLAELVKYAKTHPGMKYDAAGAKSPWALIMGEFCYQQGIEATAIPYPGAVKGMPDLLSGNLDFKIVNPTVYNQYKNKVRPLAVFADNRLKALPEVSTAKEQGYATGLEEVLTPWNGYFIRSGVPEDIKKRITEAIHEAHNSKEYIERVEKAKITRAYLNANDFARFIKESFKILEEPVMRHSERMKALKKGKK